MTDLAFSLERVNFANGIPPPKPVRAILKVKKNRDGKTGEANQRLKDFCE